VYATKQKQTNASSLTFTLPRIVESYHPIDILDFLTYTDTVQFSNDLVDWSKKLDKCAVLLDFAERNDSQTFT